MPRRALWLVAYDVRCPRRLAATLEVVKAWATSGQKSVHECWLTPGEQRALTARLRRVLDPREDSPMLVSPEPKGGVRTLGIATAPRDTGFFWIG